MGEILNNFRKLGLVIGSIFIGLALPLWAIGADSKFIWIRSGSENGNEYRRIQIDLRKSGRVSEIFTENSPNLRISASEIDFLAEQLESRSNSSLYPERGIIDLISSLYGPFPVRFDSQGKIKIVFLDADAHDLSSFEGYVNFRDQWTSKYAESIGFKSNQGNFLYLPSNVFHTDTALRNITKILPKFSHLRAEPQATFPKTWLTESLGETALFMGGFFDRDMLRFAANSQLYSLTQLPMENSSNPLFSLFGSFLLDSMKSKQAGLSFFTRLQGLGRDEVESFFRMESSRPVTFDVIFANFVSYLFTNEGLHLPITVALPNKNGSGLLLPTIIPFKEITSYPFEMESKIYSYGFLSLNLRSPLPSGAIVDIQNDSNFGPSGNCSKLATVLWKPIHPRKIVLYSVGCDPISFKDLVKFRLRIFDKPSFFPSSPLKILP
jgi:hypothetical protein